MLDHQHSETIGSKMKKIRLGRNMTIKEFADALDVSTTTITNYEKDARTPDTSVLVKLYADFGVNLNWLIGGSERLNFDLSKNLTEEELDLIQLSRRFPEPVLKKLTSLLISINAFQR